MATIGGPIWCWLRLAEMRCMTSCLDLYMCCYWPIFCALLSRARRRVLQAQPNTEIQISGAHLGMGLIRNKIEIQISGAHLGLIRNKIEILTCDDEVILIGFSCPSPGRRIFICKAQSTSHPTTTVSRPVTRPVSAYARSGLWSLAARWQPSGRALRVLHSAFPMAAAGACTSGRATRASFRRMR